MLPKNEFVNRYMDGYTDRYMEAINSCEMDDEMSGSLGGLICTLTGCEYHWDFREFLEDKPEMTRYSGSKKRFRKSILSKHL